MLTLFIWIRAGAVEGVWGHNNETESHKVSYKAFGQKFYNIPYSNKIDYFRLRL
jgi:hypothetical protein